MNNVRGVCSLRALVQKSSVGDFQAAGGYTRPIAGRARFSVTSEDRRADFEQASERCSAVDVHMPMVLGDENQLETDCGGDQCRFSAIRFRSGDHAECIWHVKCHDQVSGGSLRWIFSVHFVTRLMGQV
jgi:hypothetical protein